MRTFSDAGDLRGAVGRVVGRSRWHTVTADQIVAFADVSGDRQWIHTDRSAAADGPYGALIAHGALTLSLLPAFAAEVFHVRGVTRSVTYGIDRVRFIRPVTAGSRLRSTVRLTKVSDVEAGIQVSLTQTLGIEVLGRELPACVAETVTRFYR